MFQFIILSNIFSKSIRVILEKPITLRLGAVIVVEMADTWHLMKIFQLTFLQQHVFQSVSISTVGVEFGSEDDALREVFGGIGVAS